MDSDQQSSELQVVHGCLSGDGQSFHDFVSRFRRSVYGLCYRLMGHHEDAEDLMQDTFLRALKSLHCWDQSRPLRPWLLTIATNRCKTALSKRSRSLVQSRQELAEQAVGELPGDYPGSTELAEEIELSLQELNPKMQECFRLFYQEQLSCAEIAEILNHPEGTIKTWLHRCRQHLAGALRQRGYE